MLSERFSYWAVTRVQEYACTYPIQNARAVLANHISTLITKSEGLFLVQC